MKTELSPEDRERIEQEAKEFYGHWGAGYDEWIKGAEYATKFEREQQADLRNKVIEEYHHAIQMWLDKTDELPTRLQFITKVNELLNSLKTK